MQRALCFMFLLLFLLFLVSCTTFKFVVSSDLQTGK